MAERIAVVTGVSKGLGAALASTLLERGFDVVGVGRSAAANLTSRGFRLVTADLADVGALAPILATLFDELKAQRPTAIAVINNAAVAGPAGTIGAVDANEALASLAVNLAAPIVVADAFVRAFAGVAGERRLVNVSSGAAARAIPGGGVYCIGKAGLEMLTQVVAAEHGASGLQCITIRPGIIDTPMQVYMRSQTRERLPSVDMFAGFHASGQLVPPAVAAAKIVDRLVVGAVENGRTYSYAEL